MPKVHVTYEFDSEEEMRAHFGAEAQVRSVVAGADEVRPNVSVSVAEDDAEQPTRNDVDAEGMPYDESVHSDPPSFTAKGLWRAQRGKADEANAARAAWKAKGGDVTPPEPVAEAPDALPGLPGITDVAAETPEPISLDRVFEKINGMLSRSKVDSKTLENMYATATGVTGVPAQIGVLNTNETARATLFSALCEIEPELA